MHLKFISLYILFTIFDGLILRQDIRTLPKTKQIVIDRFNNTHKLDFYVACHLSRLKELVDQKPMTQNTLHLARRY